MKKLFMVLGFLILFCSALSARMIFDGKIIFTSHATNKDSVYFLIVEKASGVLDTVAGFDTLGNVTLYGNIFQNGNTFFVGDTLFFVDVTLVDTCRIYTDGNYFYFDTDIPFSFIGGDCYFSGDISAGGTFVQTGTDAQQFRTNCYRWYSDYDDDDALAYIYFHGENEHLVADSAGQVLSWTGVGGFEAPKLQSGFFFQELLQDLTQASVGSGSLKSFFGGFTTLSSDSLTIDSLLIMWRTSENDVYIDSVYVSRGITRVGNESGTLLMGDGTNYCAGSVSYIPATYAVDLTVSCDWRLQIVFYVETSGTVGTGYCHSVKAYCHY